MRNLFALFIKFHLFFLFLLLEAISVSLLLSSQDYHRSAFINTSTAVSGALYKKTNQIADYFRLGGVNDSLLAENARLRNLTPRAPVLVVPTTELGIDVEVEADTSVPDTASMPLWTFIPTRVINNSVNRNKNFIYLDKGSKQGVRKDMGVINQAGIIGVVVSVSSNYSMAMSILHVDNRVSAKLKRSGYFGNLTWRPSRTTLAGLPMHIENKEIVFGDTVVSSGYSSFFPEDIPIGTVKEYSPIAGTNFLDVEIELAADFRNLRYAYIADFKNKDELERLQELEDRE